MSSTEAGGDDRGNAAATELRISLAVDDIERLRTFYRDTVGLREEQSWAEHGHGVVFAVGRATLELLDREHADHVDELEVGRPTAATVRLALQVADTSAATERTRAAGAEVLGEPRRTPWGDDNARVQPPEGPALTFFSPS